MSVAFLNTQASATTPKLDAADFDPGFIIDDETFVNTQTMTISEIQAFLESHVTGGACDRNRSATSETTTETGDDDEEDTNQPPWTCLFEFQQNVETGEHNYGLFDENGDPVDIQGGSTAAEIIWQAGQDHNINPQVLITLLQKEQSLVTDNWPWPRQFQFATGYMCPDSSGCDDSAGGFYYQVNGAAWQFRRYLDNFDDYWYIIGENTIQYHPNTSCGSTTVDIKNKATGGLYLYTPYVPNQAALDNLYGQGDSCSSYGNRNFWTFFNRWFGDSTGSATPSITFSANHHWQAIYNDVNQDRRLGWQTILRPQKTAFVVMQFKNTGQTTWTKAAGNNQVTLTTADTWGHASDLCHTSWLTGCHEVAQLVEAEVAPQEIGTFEFTIQTPANMAQIYESFGLKNNNDYLPGDVGSLIIEIIDSQVSGQPHWQAIYSDASKKQRLGWHAELKPQKTAFVVMQFKNTGQTTWTKAAGNNQVTLTTADTWGHASDLCHTSWLTGCHEVAQLVEAEVAPQEIGTFEFTIQTPANMAQIYESFGLKNNNDYLPGDVGRLGLIFE